MEEADVGSAQSALPGRLSPPLPLVLPVRPPHAYAAWPRCESLAQPLGWAFLAGKSSTAARRCPRLPSADAPIPGGPSRWALPPLSNPGCGWSRLRSGFGLSNPSQRVRDWEGGAWATMLKAADCSGPWRETGIGVEVKTLSRAWRAHRTRKVKSHAQFFIHSTN